MANDDITMSIGRVNPQFIAVLDHLEATVTPVRLLKAAAWFSLRALVFNVSKSPAKDEYPK